MIKNFLFDCGNVIIGFDMNKLVETYCPNPEDREMLKKALWPAWSMQDEGMPSKDFYEYVIKDLPERLHEPAHKVIYNWDEVVWMIPGIEDLIREIKSKGYKLYLLSDMPETFSKDHSMIKILDEFDGLFFSYDYKITKKKVEFFEICLKEYNLKPEECLFVDDLKSNIDNANRVKINTFHFDTKHPEVFINYVKDLFSNN